jgi:hypothetical protein
MKWIHTRRRVARCVSPHAKQMLCLHRLPLPTEEKADSKHARLTLDVTAAVDGETRGGKESASGQISKNAW